MKKGMLTVLAMLLCVMLLAGSAAADTLSLSGTVIPAETVRVYAPISGTAEDVKAEAGQRVKQGEILYTMKTTRVYADRDGTVTGVFGQPGDVAETVAGEYGAVLYLEGETLYTVSASTDGAYASAGTKIMHTGETVYMVCRSNMSRTGKGTIVRVEGNSYTVQVTEGNFIPGDSVDIFRDESGSTAQKTGRGTVSRVSPAAVTAAGSIVSIAVKDGDTVKRGDLLLETLEGTFEGYAMSGTDIPSPVEGIVGTISVHPGENVPENSVAAEIYPLDRMLAEAQLPEDYCSRIHEGDTVKIELVTDESKVYEGKVVMISALATAESEEVTYRMTAEFVPDEAVRFGMTTILTLGEEDAPKTEDPAEQPAEETGNSTGETGKNPDGERRQRPEGSSPEERPRRNGKDEAPAGSGENAAPADTGSGEEASKPE
ncbi:MAG: HlyD family efflux transporter periplasmic adaptor subunit [Clostridia bacterium]|nr:HlyD family efflux transporter periplasmic adaptor subunit [Clostridia bacterium]